MNKLLLTFATVLLISGCSREPNIYLNCALGVEDYFELTIDASKKAFIFSRQDWNVQPLFLYTEHDDKLISEKAFIDWGAVITGGRFEDKDSHHLKMQINDFDEYTIYTFDKINNELRQDEFFKDKEEKYIYQCTAIEQVMKFTK
tara:strand:- start:27 stop:461 length:435 start_codon:yes stop_codon:yes gene_type:complete